MIKTKPFGQDTIELRIAEATEGERFVEEAEVAGTLDLGPQTRRPTNRERVPALQPAVVAAASGGVLLADAGVLAQSPLKPWARPGEGSSARR